MKPIFCFFPGSSAFISSNTLYRIGMVGALFLLLSYTLFYAEGLCQVSHTRQKPPTLTSKDSYKPGEERTKQVILEQFRNADLIIVYRRKYFLPQVQRSTRLQDALRHKPQAQSSIRQKDIPIRKINAKSPLYQQLLQCLEKPFPISPDNLTKGGQTGPLMYILKLMKKDKIFSQYFYRANQNLLECSSL